MAQRAVIIGGGAIGVAAAYYLTRDGWQVTIVDGQDIGRGCSYGNAGLIVCSHPQPLPAPGVIRQALGWMRQPDSPFFVKLRLDAGFLRWLWEFRGFCRQEAVEHGTRALLALTRASAPLFDELTTNDGIDFFYRREGLLHVYLSQNALEAVQHERDELAALGLGVRVLPRDELMAFEPALGPAVRAGLFVEGEAHGSSFGYVRALAAAVESRGGRLLPGRRVSRIAIKRGRATGVVLAAPDEELPADLVVLAAGAWAPSLAAPLGLRVPVQPAKGYSCTIDTFEGAPRIPIRHSGRKVIITPMGARLRFAGTLELAGYDSQMNKARYGAVVSAAREALKEPLPLRNEEAWSGFRPLTPDGLPIIDRAPGIENLILATGHGILGFTLSPITGKLVAELAQGRPPSVPLEPFRLGRF